ncbi:MAG TPA: hypothetical protein VKT71_03425 [Candidatus Acidoferrales bacterium]|nr:hypothetical protein [Candidatus Acidoferrales bacterium]
MLLNWCDWLQHSWWVASLDGSVALSVLVELGHYFGFFLIVGSIVVVDLRILGLAGRGHDAARLAGQLFPVMWTGLFFALLTGFLMFADDAVALFPNPVFRIKLLVVLLAVIFGAIVQWRVGRWDRFARIPVSAKCLAAVSLALWIGAILSSVEVPHLTYVP